VRPAVRSDGFSRSGPLKRALPTVAPRSDGFSRLGFSRSGPLKRALPTVVTAVCLLLILSLSGPAGGERPVQAQSSSLGYGFNVAQPDVTLLTSMGFDWIKLFGPPGSRLPVNVLLRLDAHVGHLNDVPAFAQQVRQIAQAHGAHIEAYEIGNEVNLDAAYGWNGPPNAAAYVTLLCAAYQAIKESDPGAIVVSAGLAPTGRVQGNWNGHAGHNGSYQDERQYLHEFFSAGGGSCLDAVGYHPYGFSADYDAVPDHHGGSSEINCSNGFCFRGVEKIYEVMVSRGWAHKRVWATEFGWLVPPPPHCLNDPGWQGRQWQIVTEAKQAGNLAGAFQYAAMHYPWLEAMFVFNLNFNTAPWYPECEQMRFYAVAGRPAETALRDLPKSTNPGHLALSSNQMVWLAAVAEQPLTTNLLLRVGNEGGQAFVYTAAADTAAALVPTLGNAGDTVSPGAQSHLQVTLNSDGRPTGLYTGTITIEATPLEPGAPPVQNVPQQVTITLYLVEEVYRVYLPGIER
jgi:hypothetical protein